MSLEPSIALEQQQIANLHPEPPLKRPRTPVRLKLNTRITVLHSSSSPYTPYSSFRSSPAELPTPASIKARQCLAIFNTFCLFNTAYPFRPGVLSHIADSYDVSCCHLKAAALGLDWVILNVALVSAGYLNFCLASFEEAIGFKFGRRRMELRDLEKLNDSGMGLVRKREWEVTWWPGYFWALAIGEILMLQGAVVSESEMMRMGAVGVVVVLGWCFGWRATRPLGVRL
ncbi:hypothetical protein QBC44DRAFT_312523 [Cladorrhinum sp. PSN332]|nr:hypothetical protein QBC44DRAFT_312523 [Cladorrhinum sp. PSN332]